MGKVSCDVCGVICTSARSLSEHVAGLKHRSRLVLEAPAEVKELGRLQYFIDKHLKEIPLLGLEYVVERQLKDTYIYSCQMCSVENEWLHMVAHIMDIPHMELYIQKHHSELSTASSHLATKGEQSRKLRALAQLINTKYGRREIHMTKSDVDPVAAEASPSAMEVGKRNGAVPSSSLQTSLNKQRSPQDSVRQKKSSKRLQEVEYMHNKHLPYFKAYSCVLCKVFCSSATTLCEHVLGKVHKKTLELSMPEQLKDLGRLNHFLHNHLKTTPILGLEYIEELQLGSKYKYSCQMCSMDGNLQKIVNHITDIDHTELYIKKHYPNLLPCVSDYSKRNYLKVLTKLAATILEKCGHKEIKNSAIKDDSLQGGDSKTTEALKDEEGDTRLSKHDLKRKPLPYEEAGLEESHENTSCRKKVLHPKNDVPPMAKRGRISSKDRQDSLAHKNPKSRASSDNRSSKKSSKYDTWLDSTTAEQELEIQTNDQFLDYLAKFVIDDDDDAVFIRKITQNCIKALTVFQQEEAERQVSGLQPQEASLAHRSRTDQEPHGVSKSSRWTQARTRRSDREPRGVSNSSYRTEARTSRKDRKPRGVSKSRRRSVSPLACTSRTDRGPRGVSESIRRSVSPLACTSRTDPELHGISRSSRRSVSPLACTSRTDTELPGISKSFYWPGSPQAHTSRTDQEIPGILQSSRQPETPLAHMTRTDQIIGKSSHWSEASLNHTSRIDQETTDILQLSHQFAAPLVHTSKANQVTEDCSLNKLQSRSSGSETTLPSDTSNPFKAFIPKNEITNFFFSSIKNMDESEVTGIFQKIATTNPEFQGMDIPAVIRFLKDSGKLKNP